MQGDHLPTAENNVPMNGETRVPPAISEKIDAKASHDQSIVDFHRFTDIYLGGLWNRLENQLPKHEGVDFEYVFFLFFLLIETTKIIIIIIYFTGMMCN